MREIQYEIVKEIAVLSTGDSGYTKEINLISWNGKEPKYDIRSFSPNREKCGNRYKYTPEAMDELQKSLKTLEKMFNDSLKALQGDESVQIEKLIKRKDKIMDLDLKMRKAHVQRVNKGKCKASLTAPFTNILHLIDRMGNSCVNLADVASNEISLNYFMVN